jgi:hypothetical protein
MTPLILETLTWITESGRKIKFLEDGILGKEKLEAQLDLADLRGWMNENSLCTMQDIYQWDATSGTWTGWCLGTPLNLLSAQSHMLT